jgi:hypothetical protein
LKKLFISVLIVVCIFSVGWTFRFAEMHWPVTIGVNSGDLFHVTGNLASFGEQHWVFGDTTAAGDKSPISMGTVGGNTMGAWEVVGGSFTCKLNSLDSVVFYIWDSVGDTAIAWSDTLIGTAATAAYKTAALTITAPGYSKISTAEGIGIEVKPIGTDTVTDVSWDVVFKEKHNVYQD